MRIADTMLPEFDHEVTNTRKTLERVAVPAIYGPSADESGAEKAGM